ncbi:UDP-N-acetylmuramate--L-alanine ligase [Desulfonema magnum]|uniref:UDP-N-acetylmuramate--L-alanine ligase, MurC-like n=1 Tax=Desulfonema magnum TaxID=45655 RepID=A0A975GK11_9BACT|nr:UDP-N-acetylmuramate--L-alanine ligase [Desulfonema magnum]QTA84030.1 UDP-N-acetylmuramate--L-alanine ligase, MurC-like [Desulfonema magnum]
MNLTKNRIPDNIRKIHLIAICGTAMGALAAMLKDMGFEVTGSDHGVYPPMSDFLASKGIEVADGFNEKNIAYGPDLVIVGNAVTKNNPEAREMFKMGLHFCSMPQAVNRFLADGKKAILATGTHGKTTTSSVLAWMLYEAGLDPSFMIGGILKDFDSNYRLGKGDVIVIEGDEYDTAFFDKGPKFLHYDPFMTVLTSVEFDHADIFRDLDHVKNAFDTFISGLSPTSTLLAFNGDDNVSDLVRDRKCRVVTYGRDANSLWQIGEISISPPWNCFEVLKQGKHFSEFRTTLVGEYNLLNALSAIAIADSLKIPARVIGKSLETFQGIKRRQEVRGQKHGITVIDDFAHHPTAVQETIRAVKPFYPEGRLIAVFEPRTNSSMRKVFQDVYPLSFDDADMICIRHPSLLNKIPADERFSSEKLVDDLKNRGKDAHHFPDTELIIDFLVREATSGDVILIMSNGGFDNIHERVLKRIEN